MVALSAQQLCLRKVDNPLNFGVDPCCHGNEIWPRHGDLDAYRLVHLFVFFAQVLKDEIWLKFSEDFHDKCHDREYNVQFTFSRSAARVVPYHGS